MFVEHPKTARCQTQLFPQGRKPGQSPERATAWTNRAGGLIQRAFAPGSCSSLPPDAIGKFTREVRLISRLKKDRLRLLVVDDEEPSAFWHAARAETARSLVKQQEPDLMLLNMNL